MRINMMQMLFRLIYDQGFVMLALYSQTATVSHCGGFCNTGQKQHGGANVTNISFMRVCCLKNIQL